ncbi:MAG: hypothetical protein J6U15_08870, partial [Lachnospiraceae bacterium]|nr:hypothetical protein [Lachnospiraceae bacterium]
MRKILISLIALPMMVAAENIDVTSIRLAGPYPTVKPFMTDSLDAEGKKIDLDELYMETTPLQLPRGGENTPLQTSTTGGFVLSPSGEAEGGCYLASFTLQNTGFAKGKVNVKCESKNKLFIDGNEQGPDFELVPGRHGVSIKLLVKPSPSGETERGSDTLRINVETEQHIEINPDGNRY